MPAFKSSEKFSIYNCAAAKVAAASAAQLTISSGHTPKSEPEHPKLITCLIFELAGFWRSLSFAANLLLFILLWLK